MVFEIFAAKWQKFRPKISDLEDPLGYLRSADRGHLHFPSVKLASYGGRSFAYAGPSSWNSLPAYLRDSSLSLSSFKHHLKIFLFSFY